MIIKVDADSDAITFGIRGIRVFRMDEPMGYSMVYYMDVSSVKSVFTKHTMPFMVPDYVIIFFDKDFYLELDFYEEDKMKNMERFIESVMKMRLAGTKWAEDHPEKYI